MSLTVIPTPPPLTDYQTYLARRYREQSDHQSVASFWEPREFSLWDVGFLLSYFSILQQRATSEGVDISTFSQNHARIQLDSLPLQDPITGKINQLAANYVAFHTCLYCNQVICEITTQKIKTMAAAGRAMPSLEKQIGVIDGCEIWALKLIPEGRSFREPRITDELCRNLMIKVDEIKQKIMG
jgi:hypothetical protein